MAREVVLVTQWRDRLKRQAESGLTVEAFCQNEGVSTSMFYRWQRQLQRQPSVAASAEAVGAAKPVGKRRGRRSSRPRAEGETSNVPAVEPWPEFLRLPVRNVRSMPWIELTLVDGTVIRIPQENHAALSIVLRTFRPESGGSPTEALHA
jgi:transposase-like protein